MSELYEKASRKNDLTYGKYDIISVANMYFKPDSYITDERYLLTYNIFELGDIAFEGNKSKNYAHGRFVENTIGNGIVSHVFDVFKPIMKPYDLQFWKYAINNERLMGGILLRSTKASTMMTNLVANDFLQETFLVPSYPEQQKIGAFFQGLDNLITLHQRNSADFVSRFLSDFTNTWEQRKLGEVLISLQNNTLSRADLSSEEGIAKNIHYGDILVKFGEVIDLKTESLPMIADETVIAKYKSSFLQNGDVIVADTAEDETVGKCTEIAGLSDEIVISGLHTIPYRPLQKYAPGYLGYYMNSASFHNQLLPLMQGIKVTSISKTALQNTDILYPKSATEQAAIGKYFRNLDNLITLHQRNSADFVSRFLSDFTNTWEQRKFEDIAVRSSSISSESGLPRVEYEDIISGTGRLNKDIFAKESDKTGIVFHKGDVLYGKLRPYLQNWLLPSFNGLAVGDFWVLQPQNADSSFLYRLIQSRQFDEVANQSTGTKMPRSDWKLVSKTEFFIPSAIGEQAAIGAYFEQLDNLITLHQRECFFVNLSLITNALPNQHLYSQVLE